MAGSKEEKNDEFNIRIQMKFFIWICVEPRIVWKDYFRIAHYA